MRARILNTWDNFRTGFWFIPSLFVIVAVVLGFGMPLVDERAGTWIVERAPWMSTTMAAARPSLSAIGGAMITVTGVVFSITVVTLSITSSQFGSRMLRSFMDDRITQVAIGMFVGTSLYCFLVMRSIREIDGSSFVPNVSVALSVFLAMVSTAILVFYIHHVAISIQAPKVLAALSTELDFAIDRLFPERSGKPPEDEDCATEARQQVAQLGEDFLPLIADREGYLQAIDSDGLLAAAVEHDLTIELERMPGEFIIRDMQIARVWPAKDRAEEVTEKLNDTFIVGSRRTPRQDLLCAVDEMVEVAVRALSPGINDPFTAVTCIDRLTASLTRLAGRNMPSAFRHDKDGTLRLIAKPLSFAQVLDACFSQIRHYGKSSATVIQHLMKSLQHLATSCERSKDRHSIEELAATLMEAFDSENHLRRDRAMLKREYLALQEALGSELGDGPTDGSSENSDIPQLKNDRPTTT